MKKGVNSIRLVIYSHYFWPTVGGVETFARLLAEGFAADKLFSPVVVTETPHEGELPDWQFDVVRSPTLWRFWHQVRSSDVVFVAGPAIGPMLVSKLARKPFIIEHHGYQSICPNGLLLNKNSGGVCGEAFRNKQFDECRRCLSKDRGAVRAVTQLLLTFVRRRLCRLAFAHIAISDHVRRRHDFPGMTVIYYGIPDTLPGIQAETASRSDAVVRFAYVGRLVGEKGLPLLLDAASRLQSKGVPLRLSFIGDGELRESLRLQVEALGLTGIVSFTGFLEGVALQRELAEVDVVVMPSVWEETAGLAAMEQMMRGRCVLAADIGGLGEVVGDGGAKFRPFDVEDLAIRMEELTNGGVRSAIGRAGRARATKLFQLQRMIHEHKAIVLAAAQQSQCRE